MATLYDIYNLMVNRTPSVQHRIEGAVVVWAEAVFAEDVATANHASRLAVAQGALIDVKRQKIALALIPLFATNANYQTLGEALDDGSVSWVVNHYLGEVGVLQGILAELA